MPAVPLRCSFRTASGISEMQNFYVGALPVVQEKEPNNDFKAPQQIDLNVTVQGVVGLPELFTAMSVRAAVPVLLMKRMIANQVLVFLSK